MENTFSLVSTYINWSSLSLPTPRVRKANKSCIVSAAHPLVKHVQIQLLPLRNKRRDFHMPTSGGVHPRGEVQCVQQ